MNGGRELIFVDVGRGESFRRVNDLDDGCVESGMRASIAVPVADLSPTLLERARRGDEEAFMALVRHYEGGLRALASRLLGDRDDTADALQETFIRAFRALPDFRGESALGTWLYRITYNVCVDVLRRSRLALVPLDVVVDRVREGSDPAAAIPTRADLAAAFAALSPEERAAVLLVDVEGLDYAAAGEVLGVPAGTVGSRLNRARTALRRVLSDSKEEFEAQ